MACQTKPSCNVLIVGAGLAGLATAIAIQRGGHQVTVLERMPELQEIGAGIQLPPNATTIFKTWEILDAIEAHALTPRSIIVRSYRDGAVLTTQELGFVNEHYKSPYLLIHRADLHKVLYEKADKMGVRVLLGCRIASMNVGHGKSWISLQDGQTFEGDVIIGCDGERSVCREKLLDREDPLQSTGNLVFRFTVKISEMRRDTDLAALIDPPTINLWMGPSAHAISYVIPKDDQFNVALTIAQNPGDRSLHSAQRAEVRELHDAFQGIDPRVEKLFGLAQNCSKWSLLQSTTLPSWIHPSGRFALLGDSAHAMMPCLAQGAAQCFEDAAVLGILFEQLQDKGQLADVLSVFERVRKPHAMEVAQRSSDELDIFCMPDGPAQRERDELVSQQLPFVGSPIFLADPDFQRWLWGYNAIKEASNAWKAHLGRKVTCGETDLMAAHLDITV